MSEETWRHKDSGDVFAVEIEDDRVVSVMGPFSEADASTVDIHGATMKKVREFAGEDFQDKLSWVRENPEDFERLG